MLGILQKRLEEAANDFADKHGFRVPYDGSNNFYDTTDVVASKDGFRAGAEWMLKECREQMLEQCKEWLEAKLYCKPFDYMWQVYDFVERFENDMKINWEEKNERS